MNRPARTERNGRIYTVEIQLLVPVDATEGQITKYLEYELGGGFLDDGNPLADCGFNGAQVMRVDRTDHVSYTEWGPTVEGRASGKTRAVIEP